jgi:ribosomal protein L7/L12
MKIIIGKLTILWGDPIDLLQKEFDGRVKYNALMKNLKAALKKAEEEENEPEYIKETRSYLKEGKSLNAVKAYMGGSGKGLKESKDDVDRMKDKMIVDAKE